MHYYLTTFGTAAQLPRDSRRLRLLFLYPFCRWQHGFKQGLNKILNKILNKMEVRYASSMVRQEVDLQ